MSRTLPTIIVCLLIGFCKAPGQTSPSPDYDTALDNIHQLNTSITLDRSVYMAGEVATITVTIRNPTNAPLTVPDPSVDHEITMTYRPTGQEDFHGTMVRDRPFPTTPSGPVVTLQPGQQIQRTFLSTDAPFGNDESAIEPGGYLWPEPGRVRLKWSYSGASVEADVVAPRLLELSKAKFKEPDPYPDADEKRASTDSANPLTIETNVYGMVLSAGSESIVAVSQGTSGLLTLRGPKNQPLSESDARELAPYRRIATLSGPVQNLRVTLPDKNEERIQVSWQDEAGKPQTVTLDKHRDPINGPQ